MYDISADSMVAATISNVVAILLVEIGKRGWRVVTLKVTPAWKSKVHTYVNTSFGCHFSRLIRAVGRLISELMN